MDENPNSKENSQSRTGLIFGIVVSLALGIVIGYLLFGNKKCPDDPRTYAEWEKRIQASDAYQNPNKKSLMKPHAFFKKYRDKIEDSSSVFMGMKIELNYLKEAVQELDSSKKIYAYVVLAYGEKIGNVRAKRLCIAGEPASGDWEESRDAEDDASRDTSDRVRRDYIWTIAYNESGHQILIKDDNRTSSFGSMFCSRTVKGGWANNILYYVLPGTKAYAAAAPCKCPTCCKLLQAATGNATE